MRLRPKFVQHRFPGQSDDLRIANLSSAEERRKRRQGKRAEQLRKQREKA